MQMLCLMQSKMSLAKQQARLRADAKQQAEEQAQEAAHSMYLLAQQMRSKVGLFANMKMHQQSAPCFCSRCSPSQGLCMEQSASLDLTCALLSTCIQVTHLLLFAWICDICRLMPGWQRNRLFPHSCSASFMMPSNSCLRFVGLRQLAWNL